MKRNAGMRILSVLLSLVMALAMCTTVFATEGDQTDPKASGSITITGTEEGRTYRAYKIFDVETDGNNGYSYTMKGDSPFKSTIEALTVKVDGVTEEQKVFVLTPSAGDPNIYVVTVNDKVNTGTRNTIQVWLNDRAVVKKLARDLRSVVAGMSEEQKQQYIAGTATVLSGKKETTITGLTAGYYFVESSAGTVCFLDTAADKVTINEKNGKPTVTKLVQEGDNWVASNDAAVGDIVNFKITITPDKVAENYVLHDVLIPDHFALMMEHQTATTADGTTYETQNLKYFGGTVSGKPLTFTKQSDTSVLYDVYLESNIIGTMQLKENAGGFEIAFRQEFLDYVGNTPIEIIYSARLTAATEKSSESGFVNKAWLTFSDPAKESTAAETTTKSWPVNIFKYTVENGIEKALSGAEFKLTKNAGGSDRIWFKYDAENGVYVVDTTNTDAAHTTSATAALVSGTDGMIKILGLDSGTYYLIEMVAPDGYNLATSYYTISIDAYGNVKVNDTACADKVVKVINNTGIEMPSTGGAGTTMLYIIGTVLALGAAVVLIVRRRMKYSA